MKSFVGYKRTFVAYKRTDLCDFLYCLGSSNKDSLSQSFRTLKLKHWISLDNMAPVCNFLLSIYLKTHTSRVRNGIVPHVTVLHWLCFQSLVPIFNFRLVVLNKRWKHAGIFRTNVLRGFSLPQCHLNSVHLKPLCTMISREAVGYL